MLLRPPYKLSVETKLFELDTHKKATLGDIYLIHQQGVEGAAEHMMTYGMFRTIE